jgi:hypothetical protein
VAAEIYPGEIYAHVGLSRGFGKTSRQGRRSQANSILSWCDLNAAVVSVDLAAQIEDGFGDDDTGEDRFDSFIGTLGMIEAVAGVASSAIPDDPAVRNVEGWILGMRLSPERATVKPVRTRAAKQPANHHSEPDREKADRSEIGNHARWCPACSSKLFTRWPWGWDGHAAYACTGVVGATADERKRIYRERYLG